MKRRYGTNSMALALVLSMLTFSGNCAAAASDKKIKNWQLNMLFHPSTSQLKTEDKGWVSIYSEITDRDVERAMDQQFDRIEHMMFVRTVLTNDTGEAMLDDSGNLLIEEDGCDD
ncbi:MAG: hypothetical protein GY731_18250 [Gammaproteobacteria bacterium]|nr:hypothetical protein [Gammaproteobacteria bacterium]